LNVEGEFLQESARRTSAETVAGYLSAIAIFVSVVGIAWHPLRLILPSAAVALIASGMSNSRRQLPLAAVLICTVALFLGLTVAVATSHPLW
jgi:predicted lysophospholipase L1 biosynthesis ABC-type transport system permease subunit